MDSRYDSNQKYYLFIDKDICVSVFGGGVHTHTHTHACMRTHIHTHHQSASQSHAPRRGRSGWHAYPGGSLGSGHPHFCVWHWQSHHLQLVALVVVTKVASNDLARHIRLRYAYAAGSVQMGQAVKQSFKLSWSPTGGATAATFVGLQQSWLVTCSLSCWLLGTDYA